MRTALPVGLLWLTFFAYELFTQATCEGDCSIRIDLLLILPLLVGATALFIIEGRLPGDRASGATRSSVETTPDLSNAVGRTKFHAPLARKAIAMRWLGNLLLTLAALGSPPAVLLSLVPAGDQLATREVLQALLVALAFVAVALVGWKLRRRGISLQVTSGYFDRDA